MFDQRASGVLLHPTSLPGGHGLGDFGPSAYQFIDALRAARQRYWQVLPLGPVSFGNSPYQGYSAFALNPLLISLDRLREQGLLEHRDLPDPGQFPASKMDAERASLVKNKVFDRAFERFHRGQWPKLIQRLEEFRHEHRRWLPDFALFMALKGAADMRPWSEWDDGLRLRRAQDLIAAQTKLAAEIEREEFLQMIAFNQWMDLKRYANERGIRIIGDAPIYVSYDSADTWSQPEMFLLDSQGTPIAVAGVPPDYFSKTGQLWGNPLYRWDRIAADRFAWWIARLRCQLSQTDFIRIDHFRGFAGYWAVPAGEKTAINGRWLPGPGRALFDTIVSAMGKLPIIAEDLGTITPDVTELRLAFGLPGMKILQFAFGSGPDNAYLPHNHVVDCVVYTGTHDNDTTQGWIDARPPHEIDHVRQYWGGSRESVLRTMLRMAFSSVASLAIVPMQDVLGLGTEARMNVPGTTKGNWLWRMAPGQLQRTHIDELANLTETYYRLGHKPQPFTDKTYDLMLAENQLPTAKTTT